MGKANGSLLRPELWGLVLPAIRAARRAGQEYAESGRYVPRQTVTKYEENDAGWPQTTQDTLGTRSKDGPLDWQDMFGLKAGPFTKIVMSDVPELHSAVSDISTKAMNDDELMRGLSRLAPHMDGAEKQEQIEFETLRLLIGSILNRADAVGAETDEELCTLYQTIERGRFCKELTGDLIVPILAVSFDADDPIAIDENSSIERLTEAEHRARALPWVRHDSVSAYVAAGATHAVVVRGVRFQNQIHTSGRRHQPDPLDDDTARRVAEAIHIVTEKSTGYAQVLVRPRDWAKNWVQDLPPLWSAWTGRAYPEELNSRRWDRELDPIPESQINDIARIAKGLETAPKNVQLAARRCIRATFRDDVEDRILDAAIGIEALVGREPDALTHRMAQRAAIALADKIPPENTYTLVKQFYGIRSKIAHGNAPKGWSVKLNDTEWSAEFIGRHLLRLLLQNRLLAEEPWDAVTLDDRMLEKFERPEAYPSE